MSTVSPACFSMYLTTLKNQYESYLYDDFLPYMESHIMDKKYGGFMCHTNRDGQNVSTNKRTWYDGRGIWVYSFLYEHFGREEKHLDVARKTVDLVLKAEPDDGIFWPEAYSREGVPLSDKSGDIYGGLFVAEGLIAYARASGDFSLLKKAKTILFDAVKQYDKVDYLYCPHYDSATMRIKGPRVLGHWMALLNISGQILEQDADPQIKDICDRAIEALLTHHLQSDFGLMIEYLNHDFSPPQGEFSQFCYIGHAIETLWMLMAEAERRKDQKLFSQAAGLFRRHVEVAWDDVYGGFFHCLNDVNKNDWLLDKVLWVQEEVMIGLMLLVENEKDPWAEKWIPKVWNYLTDTFVLQDYPAHLWINGGNRQLKQHHQLERMENYHHPRHLMFNLLRLKRIEIPDK